MGSRHLYLVAASVLALAGPAAAAPLLGFSETGTQTQRALEATFDSHLSAADIQARHRDMASQPNHVGSAHDKANAEATLARFKSWGWDAKIETFDVLFPTPKTVKLELLGDQPFTATLTERALPEDPATATADALPAYTAYQGDGDVTAEVVYVNYGMPSDYDTLERLGVSVKGKIVLARYGAGWRGLKPKLAQEHGAVGCIIYSDPSDDGFALGDVYPKGGYRPDQAFQRGSVMDMPIHPGDPATPGYGSTKGAKRLSREDTKTILKIPVLPISYGDAKPFLTAMGGEVVPKGWRGGLAQTYRVGPTSVKAHLVVESDWGQKRLYDVIARLPGKDRPNEWVVRGNHRDGWVMGAADPLSGHEAMMEEAKALGALAKTGWRPSRTIIYASWDGEEEGLLGSTEWAETHADDLRKKAVAYVNTDSSGRGPLGVNGSWSLQTLVNQAAAEVTDPETGADARTRARAAVQVRAASAGGDESDKAAAKIIAKGGDLPLDPMGSGSDYTAFSQHLGVASLDVGYGGEEDYGVYHSLYDSFEHFHRFVDPDASYQVALAKTVGRLVMRAAEAEVAPYTYAPVAARVAADVENLHELAKNTAEADKGQIKLVEARAYALADDPTKRWRPPTPKPAPKDLDFAALDAAAKTLKASAESFDAAAAKAGSQTPAQRAKVNAALIGMEQTLLDPDGLPGRPWYRHLVSAPGMLTGYGAKTLPGVREAIEARRWDEAQVYIGRTAKTLDAYSARLDQARALLSPTV